MKLRKGFKRGCVKLIDSPDDVMEHVKEETKKYKVRRMDSLTIMYCRQNPRVTRPHLQDLEGLEGVLHEGVSGRRGTESDDLCPDQLQERVEHCSWDAANVVCHDCSAPFAKAVHNA